MTKMSKLWMPWMSSPGVTPVTCRGFRNLGAEDKRWGGHNWIVLYRVMTERKETKEDEDRREEGRMIPAEEDPGLGVGVVEDHGEELLGGGQHRRLGHL